MGRARRRNDMPVVRFPADISGDRAAAAASATGENINPLKYREISVRTRRPIVGSGSGPKPTSPLLPIHPFRAPRVQPSLLYPSACVHTGAESRYR